ncbi:hypothetical protein CC85DRAFT_303235 [Cutaneotrichosporon oleaginosum]|uniref:Uncharacterized protein n=1 Tax=Cutaneotrichosporon oleaginosum TaxID=879819 RepID=A0A0J0XK42_9TREE|nr:uncharacterized protein CC85DRAFT_303235 [Cutaneotrichosporon oleaginosum]KLT41437.1 hypothetical protein CC85DRAFT_303235 [Cutaneotrichosporon oleaginosum]TXT12199.1 hypothetical protein COLE_02609 [Cutaneotrichosporon oleaginosum]
MAIDTDNGPPIDAASDSQPAVTKAPRKFKARFFRSKMRLPRQVPPPLNLRDTSPACATPVVAPSPMSPTPVNVACLPRLDTHITLSTGAAATPTAAESEHVIGVSVVRAIQGYFKRLITALRDGSEFEDLRPWLLRAPMCQYSPEMPAHLRPMALRLVDELVDENMRESDAYLDLAQLVLHVSGRRREVLGRPTRAFKW